MRSAICVAVIISTGLCCVVSAGWPMKNGVPCACTRLHDPVCGDDGQDYPNPDCATTCGGVEYRRGSCNNRCGCPPIISFVCATTPSGEQRHFVNRCTAECENGAKFLYDGFCYPEKHHPYPGHFKRTMNEKKQKRSGVTGCYCTIHYSPVCGLKNGKWTTYGNQCSADCDNVERTQPGQCGTRRYCDCVKIYNPVCARKLDGTLKNYFNQCSADCEEAITVSQGQCSAKPHNSLAAFLNKFLL